MFSIEYRTKDGDLFGVDKKTEVEAMQFVTETDGRVRVVESDGVYMIREMEFVDGRMKRYRFNVNGRMIAFLPKVAC